MDIQDILDSVTPDPAPAESDLQLLVRAWVNERVAPEILPYPGELVERIMGRMRNQVSGISSSHISHLKSNLRLPVRRERTD